MILAADIGGTKSLLALFRLTGNCLNVVYKRRYASKDFSSLEAVVRTFLSDFASLQGPATIKAACVGLAGAISNNACYLVNLGWHINFSEIRNSLPELPHIAFCNDLVATGYGLSLLSSKDILCLNHEAATALTPCHVGKERRCAILAPGTGLGEAFISGNQVFPSEGAHCEFGPSSEQEVRIWHHFYSLYGHVSYERILSGQGLSHLEHFFQTEKSEKNACDYRSPEEITRLALSEKCPICQEALDQYVKILGAEAGNLALTFLSWNGVYLSGGISPKILPKLQEETFLDSFYAKGRFSDLLRTIPIYVILNPNTALYGAASIAVKQIDPVVLQPYKINEGMNEPGIL